MTQAPTDGELEDTRRLFQFDDHQGAVGWNLSIRRRQASRPSAFTAEDLLFNLRFFHHGGDGAGPQPSLLSRLNSVYRALFLLIKRLEEVYDTSMERYVFIGVVSEAFTSNIYMGMQRLHEPQAQLANRVRKASASGSSSNDTGFLFPR